MSLFQTIRVALRALTRNKLRSFLTCLGIIIGVAAVIAMVAIGEGAKASVEETFASMGSNLLVVLSGSSSGSGAQGGFGSQPTLTWADYRAIATEIPTVRYTAPVLRSSAQVMSDEQNWLTSVSGTTPDYFDIRNWPMATGVRFTQSDIESGNKVCVLGQTVVDKLFGPSADAVGMQVRIKNIPFTVIGVLEKKGQSPIGQDYDDGVYVPYTTFMTKIQGGLKNYLAGQVMVGASSADTTARAQSAITNLLRDRHHVQAGSDDDFSIRNLQEMQSAAEQGTKTLTTLLAAIALVSLLVGGIGVMNIMLVSVTERTREIGLRIAVGAKGRNIMLQFLVEALTLSALGGLIGVVVGVVGAEWVATSIGWPLLIRPDIIVISVGFSALVGIVFGLYPAYKASQLDPIDALRYE